jgi:hypothetical protein
MRTQQAKDISVMICNEKISPKRKKEEEEKEFYVSNWCLK